MFTITQRLHLQRIHFPSTLARSAIRHNYIAFNRWKLSAENVLGWSPLVSRWQRFPRKLITLKSINFKTINNKIVGIAKPRAGAGRISFYANWIVIYGLKFSVEIVRDMKLRVNHFTVYLHRHFALYLARALSVWSYFQAWYRIDLSSENWFNIIT